MSKYTNYVYDEVSQTYDSNRFASGVEVMTFMLVGLLKKKAAEIHILEAGCGTGNYSVGFLQNGIGKVTMMDASTGMLATAKKKVEEYGDRVVEFRQHELPSMPFPDESFDVVTLIHVVHHLDRGPEEVVAVNSKERYKNLFSTIKEAYRVLKPGGVLLIDHPFEDNTKASALWITSAPKAYSLFREAYIPENDLMNMMKEEKFQNLLYVTRPGTTNMKSGICDNAELILGKEWRDTDSMWSFLEKTGELPAMLDLIGRKKEEGKLAEFSREKNGLLHMYGISTLLFGQKNYNLPSSL